MCGIFGYISNKKPDTQEMSGIVTKMYLECQNRGKDATGYAYLRDDGGLCYFKLQGKASEFIKTKRFRSLEYPSIFLAHCRAATHGTPRNNVNNQPIVSKQSGMALTHNGVLYYQGSLVKEYKLPLDGECDSEVLLRLIESFNGKDNLVHAIKKSMSKISGSATFALVKENVPILYLVKSSNPLNLAYVEELDALFYASTKDILKAGLDNVGYLFGYFKIRNRKYNYVVQEVDDDSLIVIEKGGEKKFEISQYKVGTKDYSIGYQTTGKQKTWWQEEREREERSRACNNKPIVIDGQVLTETDFNDMRFPEVD